MKSRFLEEKFNLHLVISAGCKKRSAFEMWYIPEFFGVIFGISSAMIAEMILFLNDEEDKDLCLVQTFVELGLFILVLNFMVNTMGFGDRFVVFLRMSLGVTGLVLLYHDWGLLKRLPRLKTRKNGL